MLKKACTVSGRNVQPKELYITLGEKEKQAEEQRIYDELNANGYPATFVKRVARKLKDRQKTKIEAEQKPITLASIPYSRH